MSKKGYFGQTIPQREKRVDDMKHFRKILSFCIIIALAGVGGVLTAVFLPSNQPTLSVPITENTPVSDSVLVNAETTLEFTTRYRACNHQEKETQEVHRTFLGITTEELAKKYEDFIYEKAEANTVFLFRTEEGKCDHHYLLCAEGNRLKVVFQNDPSKIKEEFVFSPEHLPKSEREDLQKGIPAESDQELSRLIEDYTS